MAEAEFVHYLDITDVEKYCKSMQWKDRTLSVTRSRLRIIVIAHPLQGGISHTPTITCKFKYSVFES